MPKRTFYFVAGTAAGLGSSLWVQRRVRTAVERYVPEKVQERAAEAAKRVAPALRDAVTEGRDAMRTRIAELLGLPIHRVSVKATTTEGMGFTGREEGLMAQAVVAVECPP